MTTLIQERSEVASGHPLSSDLSHLGELSEFFGAKLGRPPAGWVSVEQLISDTRLLDEALKRNKLAYKGTRRIAANFVVGGVTWAATAAALALMATKRRAIAPDPDRTFVRIDVRGDASGAFYDDPLFCVLGSDPAAIHERAHVVDDVPAMHEWLRSRLVDSLSPLVESLSDLSGLGRTGLWGQVAASWGSVISWVSELADAETDGVAEAEAFLDAPGRAFSKVPSFYRIDHGAGQVVAMRRGVCCLAYKLAESRYCGSCPFISDEERTHRYCSESDGEHE